MSIALDPVQDSVGTAADWSQVELPSTWADEISLLNPIGLFKIFRHIFSTRRRGVEISESLCGRDLIPDYALQEFHRLPNGNFSNRWSAGYSKSFDLSMLGILSRARTSVVSKMQGSGKALDVACGSGYLAFEFLRAGYEDVWGLDCNPYMLKQASMRYPAVKFLQAAAENTFLPSETFDAVGTCFFFHEVPFAAQEQVLGELNRVLKAGGQLAIIEPSDVHRNAKSDWDTFRNFGVQGLYFRWMSHFVFEPYVDEWHGRDLEQLLSNHGFKVLSDDNGMPCRCIVAEKR